MPENNLIGYKKVFGLVLPEWVDERQLNLTLGVIVVSLIMYFISFLVINPNKQTLDKNIQTLKTEQDSLVKIQEAWTSIEETKRNFTDSQIKKILRALPSNYSPDEAIYSIRNIALLSGVTLEGYSLPAGIIIDNSETTNVNTKQSNKFQQFVIDINTSGQVENLLKFIANLETSLPIGFVSDLNIQELAKAASLKDRDSVNMKLQITYYQPQVFKFTTADIEVINETEKKLIKILSDYYDPFDQGGFGLTASEVNVSSVSAGSKVIKNIFGD